MKWRTISGLVILCCSLAASAIAATSSPLADAAEKRDQAGVRTLLSSGSGVNAAQPDGTTALHLSLIHI